MNLHLPMKILGGMETPLCPGDVRCVARKLHLSASDVAVRQDIQSHQGKEAEDPRTEEFRARIHRDYDGVVLDSKVKPDPPMRGPYGQAYIPLKENAVPTRSKPFRLHGEKYDAMCQVTQEWLDIKFIEPVPRGVPVE